jgi:hypothetical protein
MSLKIWKFATSLDEQTSDAEDIIQRRHEEKSWATEHALLHDAELLYYLIHKDPNQAFRLFPASHAAPAYLPTFQYRLSGVVRVKGSIF